MRYRPAHTSTPANIPRVAEEKKALERREEEEDVKRDGEERQR